MNNEQTSTNSAAILSFHFKSHQIRTIRDDHGNLLFVAKDVATALGYADTKDAISRHCKGAVKRHPLATNGGVQEVRLIHEPDLYRLVANSQLASAERFERWLFEEVLPSIRKTGGYLAGGSVAADDILALVAEAAKSGFQGRFIPELVRYRRMGLSQREISRLLDRPKSTIGDWLRKVLAVGIKLPGNTVVARSSNAKQLSLLPGLEVH